MGKHSDDDRKNPQNRVHEQAREADEVRFNLTKKGLADDVGLIEHGAVASAKTGPDGSDDKKKRRAKRQIDDLFWLQQQLDQLQTEYFALDDQVRDILKEHLSPEEMSFLDQLPEKERHQEEMRLMREKLANGEITQVEFDQFNAFWQARAAKGQEIDLARDELNRMNSKQEADAVVEKHGAENAELAADQIGGEKQLLVKNSVHQHDVAGNAARQDTIEADLGGWDLAGDADSALDKAKGQAKASFAAVAPDTGPDNKSALDQDLKQSAGFTLPPPGTG